MSISIREIKQFDAERGLLETLESLAPVELNLLKATVLCAQRFSSATGRLLPKVFTFVAETDEGRIVGTASLLIEQKFIHDGGKVGHVEDVVVHPEWQRQGIATNLVERCLNQAREARCYKVVLNCKESVTPFYAGLGFRPHEVGMRLDLTKEGSGVGEGDISQDAERRHIR